jgi:hypothetical protein
MIGVHHMIEQNVEEAMKQAAGRGFMADASASLA